MRIVLASRNRKKVAELSAILAPLKIDVVPVSDFENAEEVEETGSTFQENARLKAESVSAATGLPAIADDSGLVVDAIGGEPGVRSARFAGEDADDEANNRKLIDMLADTPHEKRTASFACCIAYAVPGEETVFFEGSTKGHIVDEPSGENGFGYDPHFLSDDLGVTFAEADAVQKHKVSHRGRALEKFVQYLAGR